MRRSGRETESILRTEPSGFAATGSPRAVGIRFFVYTIVLLLFTLSLPLIVQHADILAFKEGGAIENTQFVLVVTTGLCLFFIGWAAKRFREMFILLAMLAAFAAIRELDSLLDDVNPLLGWELFGGILVAAGFIFAWRRRKKVRVQVTRFLTSRSFVVLWAGFLLIVVFAQLIGHAELLQMVMGNDYNRDYKRVIEETIELVGYFILLLGSVESFCQARAYELHLSGLFSERPVAAEVGET